MRNLVLPVFGILIAGVGFNVSCKEEKTELPVSFYAIEKGLLSATAVVHYYLAKCIASQYNFDGNFGDPRLLIITDPSTKILMKITRYGFSACAAFFFGKALADVIRAEQDALASSNTPRPS